MRKITHLPRNLLRLSGCMILFLSAIAGAQDDPDVNRLLASQCAQCHGYNGHAVGDIDGLAGESARELRDEMREMAGDGKPDEIMEHQALGYTPDQIRRMADYFAAVPRNNPDPVSAPLGESSNANGEHEDQDAADEKDDREDRHHRKEKQRADRDDDGDRHSTRERDDENKYSRSRDEDDDEDDDDEG